ncbi:MAG: hypothetical protein DMG23_00375 [Acidobacteria bacterium]|nr:MAG: hypothetical protein DMG23_00375 [Acidobacteriota bacterium]
MRRRSPGSGRGGGISEFSIAKYFLTVVCGLQLENSANPQPTRGLQERKISSQIGLSQSMKRRPNFWIADLWKRLLGRNIMMRLMCLLLPNLLWNQEIHGQTLGGYVNDTTRWLDAGCGERLLAGGVKDPERVLAAKPRLMVGVDLASAALRRNRA